MKKVLIFLLLLLVVIAWGLRGNISMFPKLNRARTKAILQTTKKYGPDTAESIFGRHIKEINLPTIPEIEFDVKSQDVYKEKEKDLDAKLEAIPKDERDRYDLSFIKEIYDVTRGTPATETDMEKWMNVFAQGASREGIYRSLVLDSLYNSMENISHPVNESVINYTTYYMSSFLHKKVDKTAIEPINFYLLKRMVTENTLDMIDALKSRPEDLFAWYAVFSGEMAKFYSPAFANDLRKDDFRHRHFEWAQNAPFQYIKSETIIKLHRIFNFLIKKID